MAAAYVEPFCEWAVSLRPIIPDVRTVGWVTSRSAGASAADKAGELRAKAARLELAAQRWEQGAQGEQVTANLLDVLVERGWAVFHDLAVPGSKSNIDHVVVGPTGVTLIDTKAYTGRMTIRDGVLWHGKYPLRREMDAITFETGAVQQVVASVDPSLVVRALVCIHGAKVPDDTAGELAPLGLCATDRLVDQLTASTAVTLTPGQIGALAAAIGAGLSQRTEVTPATSSAIPRPPVPRTTRRRAVQGRPPKRKGPRPQEDLVRVAVAFVVAGLMLVAAPTIGHAIADRVTSAFTTTTVPVAPPPEGPAPAPG